MKRFYTQFRIMLMTFALGLASVFVFSGSLKDSEEIPVNVPNVQSESRIIVFPVERKFVNLGAGGGVTCNDARKPAKNKKSKFQLAINENN